MSYEHFLHECSASLGVKGGHVTLGHDQVRKTVRQPGTRTPADRTRAARRANRSDASDDRQSAIVAGVAGHADAHRLLIKPATPSAEAYRVFIQGATGFVSMSAVRDDAEQRAAAFCRAKGDRRWEAIEETTANPPYILGNFPRIEIVFQCLTPARQNDSVSVRVPDVKYIKLVDLKRLLDTGVIT